MKSKLLLLIAAAMLSGVVLAEKFDPAYIKKEIHLHNNIKIPEYIVFDKDHLPDYSDLESIFRYYFKGKDLFAFQLKSMETDELGMIHYRYVQTYKDKPIELAEFIVHTTKSNRIYSINGKLIDQYPQAIEYVLSEKVALDAAIEHIAAETYKWEIVGEEKALKKETGDIDATYLPKAEQVFINPDLDYNADKFRAAYKFNIYAHQPIGRYEIYVDALSGEILFKNALIHTANSKGTAQTAYSGTQIINTDSLSPNSYRLRQTVHGNGVNTYDLNLTASYASAVDFTDTDNNWNNINTQLDQYATDAHWGAEQTYQYLFDQFGRNSINNAGFALNSYVHADLTAFGLGSNVNAFWDGQRMTYGDGNGGTVTPLVALDIAGHEIAHGLTTFSANLVYASESGALNESFSDIFGTAIEFFGRPNRANWLIGEDIGFALRSMSNPNQYNDPDTYDGTNWMTTQGCIPSQQNDQCGVHSNSGVQNYWFYLLSVGGNGTNDHGDVFNVSPITIDSAAAIAYRNLTVYLTRNSDFQDARFYAIESAKDIFGDCSPEVASTTNAWYAVGVGNPYQPGAVSEFTASDTSNCQAPFTVQFQDNSVNANTYLWDFGDGTTSGLRNPSHTYQTLGNYNVKLNIDGGACGVDSLEKLAYIKVDTTLFCEVLLSDGSNPTQTDCQGKLYDSGGSSGNYTANETGVITISPQGAATVTLTFLAFNVEAGAGNSCNYDNLEVFDGPTVNSNSLGVFCNNNVPTTLTSSGSSVTLRFTSDQAVEESGFEMNWSCNLPTSPPIAQFSIDSTYNCLGEIQFNDESSNAPNNWSWDFGDGTTSNFKNPNHIYNQNGVYNVKLIATNAFGSDSIIKMNSVRINRPVNPVAQSDTFCLMQSAKLYASGQGEIQWYDAVVGGNQIGIGDSLNLGSLSNSESVFVQDYLAAPLQSVGPVNNTIGSGNNFNNDQYLIFDALDDMILQRVTVFSGTSGNRAIQLRDANGIPLQTQYVFVSTGMQFINLNFFIPAGTNYQLGVEQGSTIQFYRNNGGVNYPYTIQGLVSIKRSSAQSNPVGFYYFFYDWKVKTLDCSSPRLEVRAHLDTSCTITALNESSISDFKMYPNPSNGSVKIELTESVSDYEIQVIDVTGRILQPSIQKLFHNSLKLELNELPIGLYYVVLRTSDHQISKPLIILNE